MAAGLSSGFGFFKSIPMLPSRTVPAPPLPAGRALSPRTARPSAARPAWPRSQARGKHTFRPVHRSREAQPASPYCAISNNSKSCEESRCKQLYQRLLNPSPAALIFDWMPGHGSWSAAAGFAV